MSVPLSALFAFVSAVLFVVQGRFAEMLLSIAVIWLALAVFPDEPPPGS